MIRIIPLCALLTLALAACGGDDGPAPTSLARGEGGERFLLKQDLPAAEPVLAAKQKEVGSQVTIFGRVQEMADGYAAFKIIDASLDYCGGGENTDDGCPIPWDYCCTPPKERFAAILPVELRTPDGEPIEAERIGLRELDMIAVKGTLTESGGGGLLLLAEDGWYRRERPDLSGRRIDWPE